MYKMSRQEYKGRKGEEEEGGEEMKMVNMVSITMLC